MGFNLSSVKCYKNYDVNLTPLVDKYFQQQEVLQDIEEKCHSIIQMTKVNFQSTQMYDSEDLSRSWIQITSTSITSIPETASEIQKFCIKCFLNMKDSLESIHIKLQTIDQKQNVSETELAEVRESFKTYQLEQDKFNLKYNKSLEETKSWIQEFEFQLNAIKLEFAKGCELIRQLEEERKWISECILDKNSLTLSQSESLLSPLYFEKILEEIKDALKEEEKQFSAYQSQSIIPLTEYRRPDVPLKDLFQKCDSLLIDAVSVLFAYEDSKKNGQTKSWISKVLSFAMYLSADDYLNPQQEEIPSSSKLWEIFEEQFKIKLDLSNPQIITNVQEIFLNKYFSEK